MTSSGKVQAMGVFGGTFDPIHFGHLRTAFEVLQALRFDQVRFMPCGSPPHRAPPIASDQERLAMVRAATNGQNGFVVDDRELSREGPSYSVDTLATLREEFGSWSIALIIGMDAFLGLPAWHRWRELLTLAHVVVAHRPGWRAPDSGELGQLLAKHGTHDIDDLSVSAAGRIFVLDVTQLEISSTEIRELIAAGRSARFLTPDAVGELMLETGCYQP